MEALKQTYKPVDIIVGAGHKMATTEVNPLNLREPLGEFLLDMHQGALKDIRSALTMAMTVEATDIGRKSGRKCVGHNTKPGAWRTRIIEGSTHLGILGVDTKSQLDGRVYLPDPLMITGVLRKRIEGKMAGATGDIINFIIGICRRISMSARAELMKSQHSFAQRTGCSRRDIFTEYRESLPQSVGFER